MLILNREISNKWVYLGGAVLAGVLLLVILSIPSCQKPPDTPIAAIDTLQTASEKPLLAQIEEGKKQVADYKSRLSVSEERSKIWKKQYDDLKKEKDNVKPPKTNAELRDRFAALGYAPLPVK